MKKYIVLAFSLIASQIILLVVFRLLYYHGYTPSSFVLWDVVLAVSIPMVFASLILWQSKISYPYYGLSVCFLISAVVSNGISFPIHWYIIGSIHEVYFTEYTLYVFGSIIIFAMPSIVLPMIAMDKSKKTKYKQLLKKLYERLIR